MRASRYSLDSPGNRADESTDTWLSVIRGPAADGHATGPVAAAEEAANYTRPLRIAPDNPAPLPGRASICHGCGNQYSASLAPPPRPVDCRDCHSHDIHSYGPAMGQDPRSVDPANAEFFSSSCLELAKGKH